jgi:hypothetical protein
MNWKPCIAFAVLFAAPSVARAAYVRVPTPAQPAAASSTIFLNRCVGGETIRTGSNSSAVDNISEVVVDDVTLPEYPYGDASWNEVVARTRKLFAPFDIMVTDVDPSPEPHFESIVCGTGEDAGFPQAWGVAPFTCEVYDNSINFTFPQSIGNDPRTIAETIAQEVAHTFGLDHLLDCLDPMSYLADCGERSFQDWEIPCGEYEERACTCGGWTQNPYQRIVGEFGPQSDIEGPTVAIVEPADGAIVVPGADFEVLIEIADDAGVARVELLVDGEAMSVAEAEPWGPWPVRNIPAGTYAFSVLAVDDLGNESVSETITVHAMSDEEDEPDEEDEEDDGDDGDDGESDGGGSSGESGVAEDPPRYDYHRGGGEQGCACSTHRENGWPGLLLLLLVPTTIGRASSRARCRTR